MSDEDYLQTFDSDLIERDFDSIDFFGEIMEDDDCNQHNFDDIQLDY